MIPGEGFTPRQAKETSPTSTLPTTTANPAVDALRRGGLSDIRHALDASNLDPPYEYANDADSSVSSSDAGAAAAAAAAATAGRCRLTSL